MITSFIATSILSPYFMDGSVRRQEQLPIQNEFKVTATGNPLDLVIMGGGYFSVLTPSGKIGYTQDGQFHRDSCGLIVSRNGFPVLPQMSIPEGSTQFGIGLNGLLEVLLPGSRTPTKIEVIPTFKFRRSGSLKKYFGSTWFPTKSSGNPVKLDPNKDGALIYSGYIPGFHKSWTSTDSNGLTTEVHK